MNDVKLAENLICEVMQWHSDKDSPDYNECDKDQCHWCKLATIALYGVQGFRKNKQTSNERTNG